MRLALIVVCLLALAGPTLAQGTPAAKEPAKASLAGSVVKEPGGEPLKKAIIELIGENQEEGGNYTATSDQDGQFNIANIQPGRYKLFVERPGYIEVDAKRRRSQGVSLSFDAGEAVKDELLHMLPSAIVTGRVLDEDVDPVPDAEVTVWRRKFLSAGPKFEAAASAQTNDLGEYRIGGLLAGKYYVSAHAPVNFQSLVPAQTKTDEAGAKLPDTSYVTTYYPNTIDRGQAAALDLHAGDEMPVNVSLVRTHTPRVGGSVAGYAPGMRVMVMLRSHETQAIVMASEVDKNGKFDIRHVPPGAYSLITAVWKEGETRSGLIEVDVGDTDIEGLQLMHSPAATIRGKLRMQSKTADTSSAHYVSLRRIDEVEDYSEAFTLVPDGAAGGLGFSQTKTDGSFELKNVTPGLYDVEVGGNTRDAGDSFVESISVGSKEFMESGLAVNGGTIPVEVTLTSGAGIVEGSVVKDKNEPVANAVVIAVPESKYRKRKSFYQRGNSDQQGRFRLRGLRPGNYTVFAWETLEDEQYFDPEFLRKFEEQGTSVQVEKAGRKTLALKVLAAPADQP